jgi:hypothetical protein
MPHPPFLPFPEQHFSNQRTVGGKAYRLHAMDSTDGFREGLLNSIDPGPGYSNGNPSRISSPAVILAIWPRVARVCEDPAKGGIPKTFPSWRILALESSCSGM